LPYILHSQWDTVCETILDTPLCEGEDEWIWKKGKNGKFSVKYLYDQLVGDDRADSFSRIRKAKIPYKIKIFLWLVENNVVLTRDNMLKRKRVGDPTCQFCKENETNDHLCSSSV
jgi:hypothetical protein